MSIYADYRLDDGAARDPIEDAVSLGTVASLGPDLVRILVSVGLGTDRYNHVSNASSLRAIAELTHLGGFLGSVSLEPSGPCFRFYRDCLEHIYRAQGFRSVLAGTVASAIQGWFGRRRRAPLVAGLVREGELFLWPLMAVLWAFDVDVVARRSLVVNWIAECPTVREYTDAYLAGRDGLGMTLRDVENFSLYEEMRA